MMALQALLFDLDSHDVTQIWVAAAAYTVLCAIREERGAQ
jgi:hypothetical protein